MEKKHILWLIVAAIIIFSLWLATPSYVASRHSELEKQGQFGDLYGSINALFSGLALLGVIAAILLQQKELSLSTKELRNSARTLQKQVELSADAARLQVLPGLIQMQKVTIKTIGGDQFQPFDGIGLNDEMIDNLLHEYRSDNVRRNEEAEKLKEELEKTLDLTTKRKLNSGLRKLRDDIAIFEQIMKEVEILRKYQNDLIQIYLKINNS